MNAEAKSLPPRIEFDGCPLCQEPGLLIKTVQCEPRGNSPRDLSWMRCAGCQHVYAKHYYVGSGRDELLREIDPETMFGSGKLDIQRWTWSGILNGILKHAKKGRLVDVGIGNGGALFTAAEMGFEVVGIDIRADLLKTPRALGYNALLCDAMDYDYSKADVVLLADVLEHVPYPRALLKEVRQSRGAVFISCPNMDSVTWKYLDNQRRNPFWVDQEHYHNFTRASLYRLLEECGFTPVEYSVSSRYQACMEVIAV